MTIIFPDDIPEKEDWYVDPKTIVRESIKWHDLNNSSAFVYFLIDQDKVVYVGQTVEIHGRLKAHVKDKKFNRVTWIQVPKKKMNFIELYYINLLKPKYNKAIPSAMNIPQAMKVFADKHGITREIFDKWIELQGYDFEGLKQFYQWWRKKYFAVQKNAFDAQLVTDYLRYLSNVELSMIGGE